MRRVTLLLTAALAVAIGAAGGSGASTAGLVAAYSFDAGSSATLADDSANGNIGTVRGATPVVGRFGKALEFDGVDDWVTIADSASLDLTTGMTMTAWVLADRIGTGWRTVGIKEQPGQLTYALYASGRTTGVPSGHVFIGDDIEVQGSAPAAVGEWMHLATTYDGTSVKLYVNGVLDATRLIAGDITTSDSPFRIGGNDVWGEFFNGRIDELRVYDRALSSTEISATMTDPVAPDSSAPTVASTSPAPDATDIGVLSSVKATFDEAMDPATINSSSFELRDGGGAVVDATVSYDELSGTATLDPNGPLAYAVTYTATVKSGSGGAKDVAGNSLAADHAWSITTEPLPPPVLVLTSATNPYTSYYPEILRAEGLNLFETADVSNVTASFLSYFKVIVLGEMTLTGTHVALLDAWVNAGGNLIAMRPDSQLSGLLGLQAAGGTLSDGYVLFDTATGPGVGLVAETLQFHGAADRYTLAGATEIAGLYSDATTPTPNPAVTVRDVGSAGGQAAAFTYDLARSVVLTRQGNPAWVGQDRDGAVPVRPNDLFFGGAAPDWVDLAKIHIPQADEQQRLLANLIIRMNLDHQPLPRFWYLPRGEKAAVVMTGDDHAVGGTGGRFDQYDAFGPAGCSIVDWECIRGTSYIYPGSPLTDTQAAGYVADGFEVALHPFFAAAALSCTDWTPELLESSYDSQLAAFATEYGSVPSPETGRAHCVAWTDWDSQPKVELENGIRFDTNYYAYPASWIATRPGLMTGSGMVMRFADADGAPIDVYQAMTQMTDESGQQYPATVNALLDRALGPEGYYGVFTANMHTDQVASDGSDKIVAAAQARGVPVVSAKQMLDWVDGRNASSFSRFSWTGTNLNFTIKAGAGANGLQAMLPASSATSGLGTLTRDGFFVPYVRQTIKGVEYAVFAATPGNYAAAYDAADAPQVTATTPDASAVGVGLDARPEAVFSVPMDASTITATSFTLEDGDGTAVPATVAYDEVTKTATLTPVSPLALGETYTARLDTTVKSSAGGLLSGPVSWSFTTGAPTVESVVPAAASASAPRSTNVEATFSRAMDAATITGASFTLTRLGDTTPVAATVTYDATSNVATLDPAAALANGSTYTAEIATSVTAADGTALAAPFTWTFSTSACPCTLYENTAQPQITNISTDNGRTPSGGWTLELGVKVKVDVAMDISAIRFYKSPGETGTHVGTVWDASGTKLTEVTFVNETAQGWQEQALAVPLSLDAGQVYVVSVGANTFFVQTHEGLQSEISSAPLRSIADGQNGVFADAAGTFPTQSHRSSSYFVDVAVVAAGDTPAPTVVSTEPTGGAIAVDRDATVEATFSRPLDPATVASSFTLRRADGSPVAAVADYDEDTMTAVLTPSSPLAFATTYTARLTTGIHASDGTAMESAYEWSFTVQDAPPGPTVTLVVPAEGTADLGSGARARAQFSRDLDAASLTPSSFTLTGPGGAVPGTIAYDAATRSATFVPDGALTHGATYTARLDASIAATDGGTLGAPYSWSFSIAAVEPGPLTVGEQSPADGATGVERSTTVAATFSRSMDPISLSGASFTLTEAGAAAPVAATVSYDAVAKRATLTPTTELGAGKTYTASIDTTAKAADGTALAAPVTWTFSTSACPCTLFPDTLQPVSVSNPVAIGRNPAEGPYSLELGLKFTVTEATDLTAVRFYKDVLETGGHTATLWTKDGALRLAEVPFTAETASGWQQQALATPYVLEPGNVYVLSVNANNTYVVTLDGLAAEIASGPLRTVADGANGPFADAAGDFPTDTFQSSNYLVDLQVSPANRTVAPSPLSLSPAGFATGVGRDATVRARFSRPLDPSTLNGTTFALRRPDGTVVTAAASYETATNTAVLTPAAPLAYGTTYTATLTTGVEAADGVALAAPVSWAFTTVFAPPTVLTTPDDGSIGIPTSERPTATFSRAMDELTITSSTFTLTKAGTPGPLAATVSYDPVARKATLVPASGTLEASSTYTARLAATIAAADGTPLASAVTWTFDTNADLTPPSTPLLTFSAFTNASATGGTVFYRPGFDGGFTVAAASEDAESAPVAYTYPDLGALGWTRAGSVYTFTAAAAAPVGAHTVTATNTAALTSSSDFTVVADPDAPVTTAACNGLACSSGWYTTSPVSLGLAAIDTGGSGPREIRYSTDGSAPSILYTAPISITATTTVRFAATDNVGNVEETKSVTVQIDTTAPDPATVSFSSLSPSAAVVGGTLYYQPDSSGGFTVTPLASDPQSDVHYDRPASESEGGTTYPDLGPGWTHVNGVYTFTAGAVDPNEPNTVIVTNGAGLSTTSSFVVTADGSAPSTSALCGGAACAAWYNASPVSVTLAATDTGSGVAATRYTTDGSDPTPASPLYGAALSFDTSTTIRYRSYDRVGNAEATKTLELRIDTVAPTATIDDAPADPSKLTSASFTFSADETGTTFECKLDSGAFETCSSPRDYTGLAEASHTFSVRATDPAGNTGLADSFTWTVDTTAPAATIDSEPDDPTNLTGASFAFSSEPSASFECKLDSGAFEPCTSPRDYTGLADDAHTFSVRATDAAGNTGAADTFTWTVDTTAPTAAIDGQPNDPTAQTSASFDFSSEPNASFECNLDSGAFEPCTSPRGYTGLADGTHTFSVRATDAAGNTGPADSFTWSVDTTAPTSSITCDGVTCGNGWSTTIVSVGLAASDTGSGVAAIRYTTDGSEPTTSSALYAGALSVATTTTIRFRAYDLVGNAEAPQTVTVRVDTTAPSAPTLSFAAAANASVGASTMWFRPGSAGGFTVSAASTDAESGVAGYAYPALGTGWSNTDGIYTFDATAGDPAEPNDVVATNGAGLTAASGFTVTADSLAPASSILCNSLPCSSGWYGTSPVTVTLAAADADSGVAEIRYTTTGADPTTASTLYTGPFTRTSTTTLKFRAWDKVGNAEPTQTQLIQIDTTAPTAPTVTLSESSPVEHVSGTTLFYNASGTNTASFTATSAPTDAQSGIADVTFPAVAGMTGGGVDSESPYSSIYTWTPTTAAAGAQTVTARNTAGLTSTASFTVTRDTTAPSGGSVTYTNGYVGTASVTITRTNGNDNAGGSGVNAAGAFIERESAPLAATACGSFAGNWTVVTSPDTTVVSGTCYRYRYTVADNVGNAVTYTSTNVVKVDTSAPATPVLTLAENDPDSHLVGTTLFYNASGTKTGSFTVDAVTSDAESEITKVNFPKPGNMTGGGDDTTAPYQTTLSWLSNTNANGAQTVTATNGADLTSTATFTVTRDIAGPTAFSLAAPTAGAKIRSGQTLSAAPADTASGVASVEFRYCAGTTCTYAGSTLIAADAEAPFSTTWTAQPADGQHTLLVRAFDNVGNFTDSATTTVTVDNSPPTTDLQVVEGTSPNRQHYRDGVLYYNPAANGDFRLLETAVDVPSGIQKVDFPAVTGVTGFSGAASTDTSVPFESSLYSFTTANNSAPTQRTVVVTDNAANTQTDTISFVRDVTAPTAFTLSSAAAMSNGDTVSANPTDAASGIAQVEFRYCPGTTCAFTSGTPIATDLTAPYEVPWTVQPADGTYRLIARATDNVGNVTDSSGRTVTVDNTQPGVTLSVVEGQRPDLQHFANGTLHYNPAADGAFTVSVTASDTSGIASVDFPALTASGFTGPATLDTTAPFDSATYTFTAANLAAPPALQVTVTDGAGNVRLEQLAFARDVDAPAGGSVSYADGYNTTGSVVVATADGTDAAGIDPSSRRIERRTATLAGGACGPAGAWATVTSPDTVAGGTCAEYRYSVADLVGNIAVHGSTNVVKVDTTAPAAPELAFSAFTNAATADGTVWFRPGTGGGFTVSATSTDAESLVSGYGHPSLGSGWDNAGGVYTFDATATDPSDALVTATNGAGLTAGTTLTVAADAAAPETTLRCNGVACSPGWYTTAPVNVTLAAADVGSGVAEIRYTTDGNDPSPSSDLYTGAIPVSTTTTLKVRAYDRVGNAEDVRTLLVQVDTSAPSAPSLAYSGFVNTSVGAGTVFYRPSAAGGFTVAATSADGESGPPAISYPALGDGWSNTDGAYTYAAGAGDPADALVGATNGAGLSSTATLSVTADSAAPATGITCNGLPCSTGWYSSTPVTIELAATDFGSGVREIRYTLDGSEPTPVHGSVYVAPFDVVGTAMLKFRAFDNVGNEELLGERLVRIDPTPPSAPELSFSALANAAVREGVVYFREGASGGFTVDAASSDLDSGIAGYAYPGLGSGWSESDGVYTFDAAAGDPIEPNTVTATNGAGLDSETTFVVTSDTAAPSTTALCDGAACVTGWYTSPSVAFALQASDGSGAGVAAIRYTTDGTAPDETSPLYTAALALTETTRIRYRAYDRVGNVEAAGETTVRIDATAPDSLVLTLAESAADMHVVDDTTLYYNPSAGHSGTFTLTATSGESESMLALATFPTLAGMSGGGDDASDPFEASYGWTNASTATGAHTVTVENEAGLETTGSFTVLPDTTGPAGGSVSYADGYLADTVAIATTNGTDGGSGIAGGTLLRQTAPLAGDTCGDFGAWSAVSSPDTLPDGVCARYRYDVLDNVGNSTTYGSGNVVKVDRTAPSAPELALSESDPDSHQDDTTLYFNPAGDGGTFDVAATSTDDQSGIARVAFPAISGATGGGDDTVASYSASYTWTPAVAAGAQDVTAHNRAALPATSSFTLAADTTAPTGQTIALSGGTWATTASVAFTTGSGSDGGSGLDAASARVERSEATLDHGTCGDFGPYSGSYASPDTSVAGGSCYRYRFSVADNVGNRSAWVDTAVVKVDTTAPPAPELAFSGFTKSASTATTVWFNDDEAGGFTVTATVDDPESGIASKSFPALGGGWDNTGGAYTFTASAADPAEPKAVTATNNAGLTSDGAGFTVTEDGSAPVNGSIDYPDGWRTTANVPVTLANGTDAGSGIDTASEQLERASATLADGVCGTLSAFTGIATNPSLAYNDGSVASGNCYAYEYEVSDRVGNTTTYTSTAVAKVDTDLPTVTQDDPGANLRAVVTLTAGAADTGGSGIASVAFERSTGPDTWAPVGTDDTAPYSASLDTDTPATPDGLYAFRAIVTDRAGNVTTSAAVVNRRIDNTKPTAAIQNPGTYLSGLVTLASTSSDDGGSGVASVEYARSTDGTTWTPTPASWPTTAADDGVYTFRVTVTDLAGNSQTSSIAGRMVDNTQPAATTTPLAAKVRGTVALGSTSSDTGGSGVQNVAFEYRAGASGAWNPTSALWDTTLLADGGYDVRVVVTDRAGNVREADPVSTTVANDAPDVASRTPLDGANDVLPATVVTATFSGPMDASTIDATSFTLRGPGDALVQASVSYDPGTLTATLTPETLLEEETTYTAHVAGTVQGSTGEPIFAAESWTFATGITPPAVTGRTPGPGATGVAVDIAPTVTFSRAMNAATITPASLRLTGPGGIVATAVTYDPATLTATITPSAQLENEAEYTVDVLATVKSTEGVSLTSSVTWSFTTSPAAPTVTGRTPAPAATGIALDVQPTVTFSRPMDATTITGSNIGLTGPSGAVAATVTYDAATMTATLTPAAALAPETAYTVTVGTGVQSADQIALLNAVDWSFTTRPPAPTVTSRTPASGATNVARDVSPTVTFSRAMDASTIDASSITLSGPGGAVPAVVSYDAGTLTATLDPSALLDTGATYTVAVAASVSSAQGIPLDGEVAWSFSTVSPPTVADRTPADGATGVSALVKPTATFSRAMNAGTISAASFTLSGPGGAVAATVSYDAGTLTATLTPSAALTPATTYTASLTDAVAAADGIALVPTSWSFTTTAAPEVLATNPAADALDVTPASGATGPKISATFTAPMNAATITTTSFSIWKGAVQVPATMSYDAVTRTASATPTLPLDLSTVYTAKLATTLTDATGVALAAPVTWNFTTSGTAIAARVQAGTTTAYTATNGNVFRSDAYYKGGLTRSFTQTVTNTVDQQLYKDERYGLWTYNIPVSNGTYDVKLHFAEMTFAAVGARKFHVDALDTTLVNDLSNFDIYAAAGNVRYKAHVVTLTNITVVDGKLDLKAVAVTSDPVIGAIEVVPRAPTVTATTPSGSAVSRNANVTATFDRAVNLASVQGAFTLAGPGGAAVAATVTLDGTSKIATLDPSATLAANTTYTATIATTARDTSGMTIATPVVWSFTTGAS